MSTQVPIPSYPSLKGMQVVHCARALEYLKARRVEDYLEIDDEFTFLEGEPHGSMVESKVHGGCLVAKLDVNLAKNRYPDVLPFDGNRVVIDPCKDQAAKGYINASYIISEARPSESISRFIATQGPLPETFEDFWEMILQNHCPAIVMLTDLKDQQGVVKCGRYFEVENGPRLFGNIRTDTTKIPTTESSLVVSQILVNRKESDDQPLEVSHIQYLGWPDDGVPDDTVAVREIFRRLWHFPSSKGPIVVHCSEGIGRTGTYCVIHNTIQRILAGDMSAVYPNRTINTFRAQRMGMVRTLGEYVFCHDAIIDILQDLISDSNIQI